MAALLFSLPSSGISYAATSTKIFTTPITVAKDQSSVTIQFPLPAISGTSVDGHQSFPAFLPTLVISKAVGVVIDAKNKLVNTGTLVQFPPSETDLPSQILDAHEIIGTTRTCLEWRCWPRSVIAGATAAIILCTIGIGFLIWWLLGFPGLQRKRSNSRKHREEEGESASSNIALTTMSRKGDKFNRHAMNSKGQPRTLRSVGTGGLSSRNETISRSRRSVAGHEGKSSSKSISNHISEQARNSKGAPALMFVDVASRNAQRRPQNSRTTNARRTSGRENSQAVNDLPRAKARGRGLERSDDDLLTRRETKRYHGQPKARRYRSPFPRRPDSDKERLILGSRGKVEEKKDKGLGAWLALLPDALTAMNMGAQPKGGWHQYHKSEDKKKGIKLSRSVSPNLPGRQRGYSPRSRSLNPEFSRRRRYYSPVFYGHKNVDISAIRHEAAERQRGRTSRRTRKESSAHTRVHHSSFGERRRVQDIPEELRRMESARSNTMAPYRSQRHQGGPESQLEGGRRQRASREHHSSPREGYGTS